jgi:tRNA G18 (ribose-2'-O)-methylase SpoU
MPVVRIDQLDDPRIRDYRNVSDAELLRRRNLFVAEGRLVVGRLLETQHHMLSLLLNEAAFQSLEKSLASIVGRTPVYICDTEDFTLITGFRLHRGCLALAARPQEKAPADVAERSDILLVLEGVTDPDNIGSVFRNAAAFGANGVLLSPTCCDPLYRKAIRTSMGSVLKIPYARIESWPEGLKMLTARGFTIVALTPRQSSIALTSCRSREPGQRLAMLVGSEGPGLSAAAEAMADVCVRIPIRPDIDSLNLATATGIALYHLTATHGRA